MKQKASIFLSEAEKEFHARLGEHGLLDPRTLGAQHRYTDAKFKWASSVVARHEARDLLASCHALYGFEDLETFFALQDFAIALCDVQKPEVALMVVERAKREFAHNNLVSKEMVCRFSEIEAVALFKCLFLDEAISLQLKVINHLLEKTLPVAKNYRARYSAVGSIKEREVALAIARAKNILGGMYFSKAVLLETKTVQRSGKVSNYPKGLLLADASALKEEALNIMSQYSETSSPAEEHIIEDLVHINFELRMYERSLKYQELLAKGSTRYSLVGGGAEGASNITGISSIRL